MLSRDHLRNVPLPKDLTNEHIFLAMEATQNFFTLIRERTDIRLSDIIQANNFSGIVSNVFTKMLNDVSPYKSYHDQRYPDLKHEDGSVGLEVKATKNALKGGESHNGHSGWHIIVCYQILDNGDIEFTQVEIAELIGYGEANSDWNYQGSSRNSNNSQRTETYNTTDIGTAKLRDGSAYLNSDCVMITPHRRAARRALADRHAIPDYSPFFITPEV